MPTKCFYNATEPKLEQLHYSKPRTRGVTTAHDQRLERSNGTIEVRTHHMTPQSSQPLQQVLRFYTTPTDVDTSTSPLEETVPVRQCRTEHETRAIPASTKHAITFDDEENVKEASALGFVRRVFYVQSRAAPFEERVASFAHETSPFTQSKGKISNNPCAAVARETYRGVWTDELHGTFVRAVSLLGGAHKATPMAVKNVMNVPGLTRNAVSKHLQTYRAG